MAEAPNLTTSKVRLWDRLLSDYNVDSGDGLVLHPETELAAIVMATDDYIVSSGNSLTLNADSVWSGNISAHVASEYCPLSKVVDGNTQYAEMYVSNGTATVTPVPTSTGYGTLINALSTTTSVGPVSGAGSATNDYIPTERAVALALEGKQQVLSGGACITLTPGENYTDISVNIQSDVPLPVLSNATQSRVPTEYVVRHAIDTGDIAGSNYAYGLVSGLSVNIQNAGYVNSTWCLNTFMQKGETPSSGGSDVPFANYDTAGKVMPVEGSGLLIGGQGSLTLAIAGADVFGGVKIGSGLDMSGTFNDTLYLKTATTTSLGGVKCGTGLDMSGTASDTIRLHVASGNAIGGVQVPASSGLTLNSTTGALTLSQAPVGAAAVTYASAVTSMGTGGIGGVFALNHLESAVNTTHAGKAVVPTVDAVCAAHGPYTPFYAKTSKVNTSSASFQLNSGQIFDSNYNLLYEYSTPGKFYVASGGDAKVLYAHTLLDANNNLSAVVNLVESSASYIDTIPIAKAVWDNTTSNAIVEQYTTGNIVFKSNATGGKPVSQGSGITVTDNTDSYTVAVSPATTASIGGVIVGTGLSVAADGTIAVTATGGYTVISSGGGIDVSGASNTSYTLTLNRAGTTSATYGGVYVPSGSGLGLITAAGTSQGKLYLSSATSTALGGVKVPSNSGLSLTNGSLKLSSATTTSIGGVIVPSSSGLTIANGSLGVTSAIFGSDYAEAVAKCSSGYFGGVVLMSSIASGGADNASHAVVPTVDAVYNALQNVDASYNGPFAVVSNTDEGSGAIGCTFNGGIIHTLNGDLVIDTRGGTLSSGDTVYLYGSSGLSPAGAEHQTTSDFVIASDGQSVAAAAGETYVRLATNTGGKLIQYQYGDMGTEFWGDDYWNVFAISRMPLPADVTSSAANSGYHKNRYILDSGGSIYGCAPFNSAGSNYISSYPLFGNTLTSSQTFTYPTESGYTSSGVHPHDGLYLKHEQTVTQQAQVWLNIWSGTWPASSGGWLSSTTKMWRYVVDTCCYEQKGESWCSGAYSVQIGNITNNGAPVQLHKGALAVRGRWS